ncbi:MAG: TonB family protein [Chitinophagales bacterium]|nr:TonB family protein [Chitinophagales bacterium]
MRNLFAALILMSFLTTNLIAQETGDTTIYKALEEMPRFPVVGCEDMDTTLAVKNQCAQQAFLSFVYSNIQYPLEARQNGNEGTVVATFVVEKNGTVTNPSIVKDIGGGTDLEVLRIINGMRQAGIQWIPGMREGNPVRAQVVLPVKFKLEEALPYVLVGNDTIYTVHEQALSFEGGDEALQTYLTERLNYPKSWEESCKLGRIELQLLIRANGDVRILDMIDYNNLGFDFWYEAVDAATSTIGKWTPAVYEGRPVAAAYNIILPFMPDENKCKDAIDTYELANQIAQEGANLYSEGETDAGIEKLSQAVEMMPENANFRLMRGQAYLDLNRFEEACEDLQIARSIALVNWYDGVLPIICK